jgi:hypothetical protein
VRDLKERGRLIVGERTPHLARCLRRIESLEQSPLFGCQLTHERKRCAQVLEGERPSERRRADIESALRRRKARHLDLDRVAIGNQIQDDFCASGFELDIVRVDRPGEPATRGDPRHAIGDRFRALTAK